TDHLDARGMQTCDHVLITGDDEVRRRRGGIVDALEPDDMGESRKAEDIAIEALHGGLAGAARAVHRITADALVDDADLVAVRLVKPPRQLVHPAVVAVDRRSGAI